MVFAVSLLFPLLHFAFPFGYQALKPLRFHDDLYLLYDYFRFSLAGLQLIFCLAGLFTGFTIYKSRNRYNSASLAVISCFLRIYPALYIALMFLFVELLGGK